MKSESATAWARAAACGVIGVCALVAAIASSLAEGSTSQWQAGVAIAGAVLVGASLWSCRPDVCSGAADVAAPDASSAKCSLQIPARSQPPDDEVVVSVYGSVRIEPIAGRGAVEMRGKSRELIVWLVTHRTNPTRSRARSALWHEPVAPASFTNVVSGARRGLAELGDPPGGGDWIGRDGDLLSVHAAVVSDAELLARALSRARSLESSDAVRVLGPAVGGLSGPPFGSEVYGWDDIDVVSAGLVELATSAATLQAELCLELGDLAGVFRATASGLRVLPAHEPLVGLRMKAHALAGEKAALRSLRG